MGKKEKKWMGGFIFGTFIILFIPILIVNGLQGQQPGDLGELENKINKEVEGYFQSDFIALLLGDQSKVRNPLSITYEGGAPIKGKITYQVSDRRMGDLGQDDGEWLYIDFIFYFDKEGGILNTKYEGEMKDSGTGDETKYTKEEIDGWVRTELLDIQDNYYDFTIEQQGDPIFYVDMAQTGIAFQDGRCVGQFGMDIYKADKGHTFLQRATFSQREELYLRELRGEYGDYNFDGAVDIRIVWRGYTMEDEDTIGYHYWLYNKETGMFEEDSTLPSLYEPVFLEKRKTVYEPDFEYEGDEVHSKFQYVNGALELVSQLKVIIDAEGDVMVAIEDMAGGDSMPRETWGKGYSKKEWLEEQINVYDRFYGMEVQGQLDKIRGDREVIKILGINAKKKKASYYIDEYSVGGAMTYQADNGEKVKMWFDTAKEGTTCEYKVEMGDGTAIRYTSHENYSEEMSYTPRPDGGGDNYTYVYDVKNKEKKYQFKIKAKEHGMTKEGEFGSVIYRLNVFSTVGGGFLQSIDVPIDAHRSIMAGAGLEVAFHDFNYDGYLDFEVLFFEGNKNVRYNYWIWDREKERYERADKLFRDHPTIFFNRTTKQFCDYEYSEPYPYGIDDKEYEIRQGELVLVKRMQVDYGHPVKIMVSKYEGGKKKVLYKATVDTDDWKNHTNGRGGCVEYRKALQFMERE